MSTTSTVVWSDHTSFLFHNLHRLYSTGEKSDLIIKCNARDFQVHSLVLGMYTDYFENNDGIWMRINVNPVYLEKVLFFMYHGHVNVQYDEMEGFLQTCRFLKVKLFKDVSVATFPDTTTFESERYELNHFQLMCRNCYKVYSDEKTLKKHTWGCTRPKTFKCRYCEKMFRHRNDLVNHENFHTGAKPFKCPDCDKAFTLKCTLTDHVNEKHKNISYKCPQCEESPRSKQLLKKHMATQHATVKPFACQECGECFALQSLLTYHTFYKHKKQNKKREREWVKRVDEAGQLTENAWVNKAKRRNNKAAAAADDPASSSTVQCKVDGDSMTFTLSAE